MNFTDPTTEEMREMRARCAYTLAVVSEGRTWEIGYYDVLFGTRVRAGRHLKESVAFDLCCGDNLQLRHTVLLLLMLHLRQFPEGASGAEVRAGVPPFENMTKPIDRNIEFDIWYKKVLAEVK